MATFAGRFGPHNPDVTYISHTYPEQLFGTGEVHVTLGDEGLPPLLLIPGQTESWWGYEDTLPLLADHFSEYAVDPRGQGRDPGLFSTTIIEWASGLLAETR